MTFNPHIFLTGNPGVGKTTIIKNLLAPLQKDFDSIVTKGFYTEEYRKGGKRSGFDIVYWMPATERENDEYEKVPKRQALSRAVDRTKRDDPCVGKYLVDINNVKNYAIKSLESSLRGDNNENELVIIDEVGKMEMLNPEFIPAVNNLLDEKTMETKRIVLGTIPTPRYGRIIQAVEDLRGRNDILVLHVTKSNRDELKDVLLEAIKHVFINHGMKCTTTYCKEIFERFLYKRQIGASAMNSSNILNTQDVAFKPCGPLISDQVQPKFLLLGSTASPLPSSPNYSYCERSLWTVLGQMFNIHYQPIKHIVTASETDIRAFQDLRTVVLSKGICVWDVLANVHDRKTRQRTNKRRKRNDDSVPNDICAFLKKHPSIEIIGFIGEKAHKNYNKFPRKTAKIELVTLPSSSPANSHLSIDNKVSAWKQQISKVISDIN